MTPIFSMKSKWIILPIILLLFIGFAFSFLVIKDFSHPLTGGGDIDYWEYTGYYLAKNLKWLPFLHLDLVNNQSFYPYGTNAVFQPWVLEKDIIYAILYSSFGVGPWLKFYYLFTVLVAATGTFTLLVKDYGVVRASGAGLLVTFFNFYPIQKYPDHLSYAVIHWTTLSIITDFLLVKRVVLKQSISLRFILFRLGLLILSLGQELGYIAGFALMSFTVSLLFISLIICYGYFSYKQKLSGLFNKWLIAYKGELISYPYTLFALVVLIVSLSYIYIPLIIQISKEAKSFDFTGVNSGAWWTHPLRLLIPFSPFVNPGQTTFDKLFGDSPEGLGASSPGWFLLILGVIGLWQARNRIVLFIPLILIFILCLFYHPINFPTLKIFPWFAFNRVADRCTVIYAVILCIFGLHINFSTLHVPRKQLLSALLVFLACTELYTAYSFKRYYQPSLLNKDFFTYMDYVKNQPGEAVLDWPFCVTGGNGIGAFQGLCPYYFQNVASFALRRFHEKKVMGQYFGRLHPFQIEPYLQAGWDKLFVPDNPDPVKATRQARCFLPQEWSFFTEFYKLNDFAGINLYVDLLPENCVKEFYSYFGNPIQETKLPWGTKIQFISKPLEMRQTINPSLGVQLKFEPKQETSKSFSKLDLLHNFQPYSAKLTGLNAIDKDDSDQVLGRWAFGPESQIEFILAEPQLLELVVQFHTPIPNQEVEVMINGKSVDNIENITNGEIVERRLSFPGAKGLNTVNFIYEDWNQNKTIFVEDKRTFAIYFTQLKIINLN